MSTRQNKKQRKGRNNANNRERTVTTLTGDPSTPYLNPPASEKAAMSTSFAGNAGGSGGGKMHNVSMSPQAYAMQNPYGFGFHPSFTPMQNAHQPQQFQSSQQQYYSPPSQSQQPTSQMLADVPLPPGKNDLEILQNLKKMILDNQHPFYKAVPNPTYLANLWKGPSTQSQQTGKPADQAQTGTEYRTQSNEGQAPASQPRGSNGDRRQTRNQTRDRRPSSGGNQQNNAGQSERYNAPLGNHAASNLSLENLNISKDSRASSAAGPSLESRLSAAPVSVDARRPAEAPESQRQGRHEYPPRAHSRDDYAAPRPPASAYDDRNMDVTMDGKSSVYVKEEVPRSGSWAPRDARPRSVTPRPQAAGVSTNASRSLDVPARVAAQSVDDREHDRSRREGWPEHDPRLEYDGSRDARQARPAQYGPETPRAPVEVALPADTRRASIAPPISDVRLPVDSRPLLDTRVNPHTTPTRAVERPAAEIMEDIGSSRSSSARPQDASIPSAAPVPPAVSADALVAEPPPLKDRLAQPPSQPPRHVAEAPAPPIEQRPQSQHAPAVAHNRPGKPQRGPKDRVPGPGYGGGPPPPYDAPHRDGDRGLHRPHTPPTPPSRHAGGGPPPHRAYDARSASVDRPRAPPAGSPASRGPPPRDYRGPPGRPAGQSYRPDYYDDPRYDPRYEGRPYRDYSPPPPAPPPAPPPSARAGPSVVEPPPASRADYYPPRGRGWEEDDYYKGRGWEGPPGERGRYDRDYPPPRSAGWEGRDREYDTRDYPPGPPPPGPPYDDRYPPGPPGDRGRPPPPPPPGGYAAPYSRVRPRSPSPIRRGAAPVDDSRPPLKRAREDYAPDYYPPASNRRPGDYPGPPRSSSPGAPPSSSGWGGPPPPSASSANSMGPPHSHPPPADRDYRMGREPPPMEYGPPSGGYDRPRSPGPPSGRVPYSRGGGGYGRGGEPRDRSAYPMQRP